MRAKITFLALLLLLLIAPAVGAEDDFLASMQEIGFADVEEAKTKIEEMVETQDWLGFRDYVRKETLLTPLFFFQTSDLELENTFDDIFTHIIAQRFYTYSQQIEYDLVVEEETDLSFLSQYAILYRNVRDNNAFLYCFLEKVEDRWFFIVDTSCAGYTLTELRYSPKYWELSDIMRPEETQALWLCTMQNDDGYTPLIFLSALPEAKRLVLRTTQGGYFEGPVEYEDGLPKNILAVKNGWVVHPGFFNIEENFSIQEFVLVETNGNKITYTLEGTISQ